MIIYAPYLSIFEEQNNKYDNYIYFYLSFLTFFIKKYLLLRLYMKPQKHTSMPSVTPSSKDVKYIDGIAQQDDKIITVIIDEFLPKIKAYIISKGGSPMDAEDIFFNALMVVFRKVKESDFKLTSGFFNYLISICRNLWLKECRVKSRDSGVTIEDNMVSIDEEREIEELASKELRYQLIAEKIEELSARCKQMIIMAQQGAKPEAIMKVMGFASKNTASKEKSKCKKKLIEKVQADSRYKMLTI